MRKYRIIATTTHGTLVGRVETETQPGEIEKTADFLKRTDLKTVQFPTEKDGIVVLRPGVLDQTIFLVKEV